MLADDGLGQRLMSVEEVARLLDVQANTVRWWDRKGLIRACSQGPGGDRRFMEKDVVDFLLGGNGGPAP